MKQLQGDIWEQEVDAICITTNGTLKCDGCAVMGAGVAKQAAQRFPQIPSLLGEHIKQIGNHVNVLNFLTRPSEQECKCPKYTYLVAFPVKHNWFEKADPALIEKSCQELVDITTKAGWENVILPRPGCDNGKLDWKDVEPICAKYFDDRFTIVDLKGENK